MQAPLLLLALLHSDYTLEILSNSVEEYLYVQHAGFHRAASTLAALSDVVAPATFPEKNESPLNNCKTKWNTGKYLLFISSNDRRSRGRRRSFKDLFLRFFWWQRLIMQCLITGQVNFGSL